MAVQNITKSKNVRPVSETRKIRKPLMERKRRERINQSLEQLAQFLKEAKLVAPDKPISKMEKADILELTVKHLIGCNLKISNMQKNSPTSCERDTKCTSSDISPAIESNENKKEILNEDTVSKNSFVEKGLKRNFPEEDLTSVSKKMKKQTEEKKEDSYSNLTLVPTRLPDGKIAFILQGDSQIIKTYDSPIKTESEHKTKPKKKTDLPQSSVKPFLVNPNPFNPSPHGVRCGKISYSVSVQPNNEQQKTKIRTVTLPVENSSGEVSLPQQVSPSTNYVHILAKPSPNYKSIKLVSRECVVSDSECNPHLRPPVFPPSPPPSVPLDTAYPAPNVPQIWSSPPTISFGSETDSSFLSSSIQLLNNSQIYCRRQVEEEEFIDVEGVSEKQGSDMWRPW